MIHSISITYLNQLKSLLSQLDNSQYSEHLKLLHNASIGMHTRHIVEFYRCLLDSTTGQTVNYDNRKRDISLESNTTICCKTIDDIIAQLETMTSDFPIKLHADYSLGLENQLVIVDSTFYRELIYNVEHVIHHLALIKIGVNTIAPDICLDEDFGVAASTMRNRKACAQ